MKQKTTEAEWAELHRMTICSILNGRCSSSYYSEMSMNSLIDEAIWGADDLVKKLKKREAEATTEQ